MIRCTLYGWLLLGKRQTRLAAPKPPPSWRLRLRFQDIGQNIERPTKRRFDFGNADGVLPRQVYEGRIINEMSEEYYTVARHHQSQRMP